MSTTNPTPTIITNTAEGTKPPGLDRHSPTSVTAINQFSPLQLDHELRNGWSTELKDRNILSGVPGSSGKSIGKLDNFFSVNARLLDTENFKPSVTASTVGDGGSPKGSTELDDEIGQNVVQTKEEYATFIRCCFGEVDNVATTPKQQHWLNAVLFRHVDLLNHLPYATDDEGRRINTRFSNSVQVLGHMLTNLLMTNCGSKALTPTIIKRVWGADKATSLALGGQRGDLALTRRRLIRNLRTTNNYLYILSNGSNPTITDGHINNMGSATLIQWYHINKCGSELSYIRDATPSGDEKINMLMTNLNLGTADFEEKIVQWFTDFVINSETTTNQTGIENGLFKAFGFELLTDKL